MVNPDKRQRHKAGHRSRVEEARLAAAKARRRRTIIGVVGVLGVIVAIVVAISITTDDDQEVATENSSTTSSPEPTPSSAPGAELPEPVAGATIEGETPCPAIDGAAERTTQFAQAPPTCIEAATTYMALVKTSEGDITITLDDDQSPAAVNNFVVLSRYKYFDGLPFHRIVTGFVNQTGSSGVPDYGSGGPGYDLPEENPTREYAPGDVAMARSDTVSGSQFFFTIDPTSLNASPTYPILGTVTAGQDVVEAINALGSGAEDGAPTEIVTIDSIAITEA